MKPSCFIIMPFRKKKYLPKDADENTNPIEIDFDEVYSKIIYKAIENAGMEPIRADEEHTLGSIHKPMFERILLSDYVVADLTGANANVFYELGIRHAVKPYTTVCIFADNCTMPFDLAPFRAIPYKYSETGGLQETDSVIRSITRYLTEAKDDKTTDSPVYQLVNGINFQNSVAHEKTDIFRDKVIYDADLKKKLQEARETSGDKTAKLSALNAVVRNDMQDLKDQETAILVDTMLSYRDISAFPEMEQFIESLPRYVRQTVMVREQYGFVLNRNKKRKEAIEVLNNVIKEHGPSSETYGILGRIYKDYITESHAKGDMDLAVSYIDDALDAYEKGFEADWRDAYPGINYVTCLELKGDRKTIEKILPVVEYAVLRKKEKKEPDYWDEATLAELSVIQDDFATAKEHLTNAKKRNAVGWMLESTKNNFILIRDFRKFNNKNVDELNALIAQLDQLISEK